MAGRSSGARLYNGFRATFSRALLQPPAAASAVAGRDRGLLGSPEHTGTLEHGAHRVTYEAGAPSTRGPPRIVPETPSPSRQTSYIEYSGAKRDGGAKIIF